ncbi:MAG TPA: hypothetical protein VKR31_06270 [Rhizomicrobium sp.]|nr:hypothetical protein [Rhizomicrobium sp.]
MPKFNFIIKEPDEPAPPRWLVHGLAWMMLIVAAITALGLAWFFLWGRF